MAGPAASCATASGVGDTHLTTFGGLLYDFQATGDFVLAESGSGFVVQTRQVSGKPKWPNASVNNAVAVQTDKSRVAICLAPRRMDVIDGRPTMLADGKLLELPDGGDVVRQSNVYVIRGPNGDSVRAVVNSDHIDISVGLGRWPSKVRGLLANAGNGRVDEIEARNGKVLTNPYSFEVFYNSYGRSWRVPSNESMLSACGESIERGVPEVPFFAQNLNPRLRAQSEAACARAGIRDRALLEACTLDVAVIGSDTAAQAFVDARIPTAVQGCPVKSPLLSGACPANPAQTGYLLVVETQEEGRACDTTIACWAG